LTIHIGMLTLVDTATEQHRQAIGEGLIALVGVIPGLVRVAIGADLGLTPGNASVIFQLTFDSEESWSAYAAHPAHRAVITDFIAPVLQSKVFVQIAAFQDALL
jgi:hypothetical protein